ncbi:MAG: hypothetical protein RI894_459 [Bacteroidota bacterium]|jgi:hypothetical protein
MLKKTVLVFAAMLLGSFLFYSCGNEESLPENVTYSEHIAPLVYEKCVPCHRPNGAGPFSLLTYDDAKRKAKTMAAVTKMRFMPPWPADHDFRDFLGEKRLTRYQIDLIQRWYQQGAQAGNLAIAPKPPEYPVGSAVGTPDYVAKMEPYPVKGDFSDRFLMVKIPYELPQDTFIRGFEFVPGDRKLVHHVNGHLIQYEEGKKGSVWNGARWVDNEKIDRDAAFKALDLMNDDGSYPTLIPLVCNYLPGVEPAFYPHNIGGYHIKKKGVLLINDLHYGPSAKDLLEHSKINFFFSDKPPTRPTKELQLGTLGISEIVPKLVIPPDTVMTFTTRGVILDDISLLTINPHMHLLGKVFTAYAISANKKDTIPLIRINKWDFRWQYYYTYKHPLHLEKGTEILVKGTFDNTKNNPLNPNNPPKTVAERNGSMRTTDEMFQFIMTFVPYQQGDEDLDMTFKR